MATRVGAGRRALLSLAALALLLGAHAFADEGGSSFWISGSYANRAALPPPPGWSLPIQLYYYSGRAPASATPNSAVTPGTRSQTSQLSFTPTYSPETTVLGAQLALFVSAGIGYNAVQENQGAPAASVSQTDTGMTDVTPGAMLTWTGGADNWLVYLLTNIPVGAYSSQRLANVGLGHGATDAGGGYTYYNTSTGLSWSAVEGITYNLEDHSTDYRNGIDSHFGWGVSQSVSSNWRVGVAGYVFYQLTGDSGSGDHCGPCKSRVASIGPQVTYTFTVARQEWEVDLRAYYEFWAQNRLQGGAFFATLTIPLSPAAK